MKSCLLVLVLLEVTLRMRGEVDGLRFVCVYCWCFDTVRRTLLKYLVFASVIFGIFVLLVLSVFAPNITCADGWASPSIGSRGACSHHGGVDSGLSALYFIFTLGVSASSGLWAFGELCKRNPRILAQHEDAKAIGQFKNAPDFEAILFIQGAIKADKLISFKYYKHKASFTETRIIKPARIGRFPMGRGGYTSVCVQGFCSRRKEMRNFSISRMSDISIFVAPSTQQK